MSCYKNNKRTTNSSNQFNSQPFSNIEESTQIVTSSRTQITNLSQFPSMIPDPPSASPSQNENSEPIQDLNPIPNKNSLKIPKTAENANPNSLHLSQSKGKKIHHIKKVDSIASSSNKNSTR
ncbi:7341_t:CDS:2 [Ambispora leptoticha]|uniref:7341_t:CDS:1 n=1 Tax=Ambispora leptoticha TaxID=144679 RepID=A0A9N8WH26_9GLOM|nr:7341_t:CDS:2 [Ambispora leptoticha]